MADTVSIQLVDELESCIHSGNTDQTAALLNLLRTKIPALRIAASTDTLSDETQISSKKQEQEFSVKVHVEDRTASATEFPIKVKFSDTIFDLKKKFFLQYNFPLEVQRWIIGKRIPDDALSLATCGVKGPGATLYLYIVSAHSVGLTRESYEEFKQRTITTGGFNKSFPSASSTLSVTTSGFNKSFPSTSSALSDDSMLGTSVSPMTSSETGNSLLASDIGPLNKNSPPALGGVDKNNPLMTLSCPSNVLMGLLPDTQIDSRFKPQNDQISSSDKHPDSGVVITDLLEYSPQMLYASAPAPQPPQTLKENVGWNCPKCTFRNLPTRPGCEICAADRPSTYEVPPNYVMTPEELMRIEADEEMERKTREEKDKVVRTNFDHWMQTDRADLIENTEIFVCPICFDEIGPRNGIVLRECLHTFCRECLNEAVQHSEEASLKCPFQDDVYNCPAILQDREVRALVSDNIYIKYLQRSLDEAESKAQNSYHCKTTDCHGWCLYEDDVNFFTCPVCKKKNCLTCKAIHEGQNCQEYQRCLDEKLEMDGEAKQTKQLLEVLLKTGAAIRCPQCKVVLQKKDGCDWVKCSICKLEICWVTKGPRWGPGGPGDTSGGCRCRVNGAKCHNDCINCH